MKAIHTEDAPKAIGPYSQAIEAGGLIFCSGQIGLDPATGDMVAGGVTEQCRQVMTNLSAVIHAAGKDLTKVSKTTIYLTNMSDFTTVNEIYGEFFGDHKPARATVAVKELPKGALVEIDAIAVS